MLLTKYRRERRKKAERLRIERLIRQGKPVPFVFDGRKFYINPEKATLYHINTSITKVANLADVSLPGTVVDVGANCGLFSSFVKLRHPTSVIHAFEPSATLVPFIKLNCQALDVNIHQLAVSDYSGTAKLYINGESQQTNSLVRDNAALFGSQIQEKVVDCTTLDDFMTQTIDVLKIDVQGTEGAVLRGAKDLLPNVQQLFIESTWMDIESITQLIPMAKYYGFTYAAIINAIHMGADIMFSRQHMPSVKRLFPLADLDHIERWM